MRSLEGLQKWRSELNHAQYSGGEWIVHILKFFLNTFHSDVYENYIFTIVFVVEAEISDISKPSQNLHTVNKAKTCIRAEAVIYVNTFKF